MQTKRLAAAALSLTLLLSACGGDPAPAGGSAQPSVPAQESQTGGQSEEHTVSYDYRDYEDRHCGFKLKTPILQRENKAVIKYAKFDIEKSIMQQRTYLEMSDEIERKYPNIHCLKIENSKDLEATKQELKEKIGF